MIALPIASSSPSSCPLRSRNQHDIKMESFESKCSIQSYLPFSRSVPLNVDGTNCSTSDGTRFPLHSFSLSSSCVGIKTPRRRQKRRGITSADYNLNDTLSFCPSRFRHITWKNVFTEREKRKQGERGELREKWQKRENGTDRTWEMEGDNHANGRKIKVGKKFTKVEKRTKRGGTRARIIITLFFGSRFSWRVEILNERCSFDDEIESLNNWPLTICYELCLSALRHSAKVPWESLPSEERRTGSHVKTT